MSYRLYVVKVEDELAENKKAMTTMRSSRAQAHAEAETIREAYTKLCKQRDETYRVSLHSLLLLATVLTLLSGTAAALQETEYLASQLGAFHETKKQLHDAEKEQLPQITWKTCQAVC